MLSPAKGSTDIHHRQRVVSWLSGRYSAVAAVVVVAAAQRAVTIINSYMPYLVNVLAESGPPR